MDPARYEQLKTDYRLHMKSSGLVAAMTVSCLLAATACFILLSLSASRITWLAGQFGLAITILQWFILVHDTGHGCFFRSRPANVIVGHLASIFPVLPFYPWRYIHRSHHIWTGWKDKDPTMVVETANTRSAMTIAFMNFCWRWWIPVFTLSFSFLNFWNIQKLFRLYPGTIQKMQNILSIAFLLVLYPVVICWIGPDVFFRIWLFAYLLFLLISDPLLLSQHSAVPQKMSNGMVVDPISFREQDKYSRTLLFPAWIERFILLGFNNHIAHHLFPYIPGYRLHHIKIDSPGAENWREWLIWAKKTPAQILLFDSKHNLVE